MLDQNGNFLAVTKYFNRNPVGLITIYFGCFDDVSKVKLEQKKCVQDFFVI